jgi:hypothetical protein
MMGLTIVVLDRMEKAVARGTKGQKSGPPEKWAPGRTLESTTKTWLSEEDISEAAQLLAAINDKTTANLDAELQSIARRYWQQQFDTERPPAQWYRTKVGGIQKQAEKLLKTVREPHGTGLSQLQFWTERRMGLQLRGVYGKEHPSIEQLLEDFVAVCKSCNFPSARGAHNKAPIKTAVASLRAIWIRFTGKEFPLNLESGDNRRDRGDRPAKNQECDEIFTSPGPRLVQIMMRKIDPNVRIGAIRTALREASVNAKRVE